MGATYLEFPEKYLLAMSSVESVDDPVEERNEKHQLLIKRMYRNY